jgi:hypothetical protein
MELEKEVLGSIRDPLILGQKVGALIVLKSTSQNSGSNVLGELHSAERFLNDALEGEKGLESVRQR